MFPTQTRSQFQLRSQVYQFLGRANCQTQLKTQRQRRVLPLRSRPTLQFPPLTAYSGSLTPRQGTPRQDLAGDFLPAEPRFPSPRSSPPGRQRSATPRHATDIASCGVRGRLTTLTRPPFPSLTMAAAPPQGHGCRFPTPGPAPVRPVGQRSRKTGERVREAAAQFQGRDSDGSHRDCRRSLPRGEKTIGRATGGFRLSVRTSALSFVPSLSQNI